MRSIVVGTAGHIDHGKSALVRALTGTDPDRLKEEKARGITIDLGFAHLVDGDTNFAFVDVPGHERFVRNMLAGAGGIDVVLLVIAADESVMPQTREHFAICRLLDVPTGAIVLTKIDVADRETQELAALESRELVAGSFLEHAPMVSVSSKTGEGLDALRAVLRDLAARVTPRNARGSTRLPVDRVFTLKGFGTVVTGTLVTGTMREGQPLMVLPGGRAASARGVQVHGQAQAAAGAGHRVAVNLGGLEVADLARGATLCEPGSLEPSTRFDVVVDLLPDAKPLRHGARVRFHQGTSEVMGRVALAAPRQDERGADEAASQPTAELRPGGSAYARLRLEQPAVVTRGDRFILRAYSPTVTIGGGVVLDPHPPRSAVRTAAGVARFRQLDASAPLDRVLMTLVDERGVHGLLRVSVVSRAGASPEQADAAVGRLVDAGRLTVVGDLLVSRRALEKTATCLLESLKTHHAAHPTSEGLHREEARARLMPHAAAAVFDAVLAPLVASGRVSARDRLSLAGHVLALSEDEVRVRDRLVRLYFDAGLAPPDTATAQAAAGDARTVDRITSLLIRQRALVKVDTLIFHADRLEALKAEVRALKTAGASPRIDVASFKERYGISRKFAIPLLEYLDRERVTKRVGEARVLI
jgi:selenocysteine-specific elongation factor